MERERRPASAFRDGPSSTSSPTARYSPPSLRHLQTHIHIHSPPTHHTFLPRPQAVFYSPSSARLRRPPPGATVWAASRSVSQAIDSHVVQSHSLCRETFSSFEQSESSQSVQSIQSIQSTQSSQSTTSASLSSSNRLSQTQGCPSRE